MINYNLKQIKGFAFDVDGVLSTNNVLLQEGGEPCRTANIKDGYAMQLAVKNGYQLAIITGGKSEAVRRRYDALGVQNIYMHAAIKIKIYEEWLEKTGLHPEEVIYMGDDIPDYEIMSKCGCSCCPADAAEEIKAISAYISPRKGGEGCVRDIMEQVMKAQGRWMSSSMAFGW